METNTSNLSWLHGLDDYFTFAGDDESKKYVDFLMHMIYADNPIIRFSDDAGIW